MPRSKARRAAGAPVLRRNVADLRALAHPIRLRMMELFAESPKTTKQVAELLGQPPTRLYHHVAALERVGLLVLKKTRQNRGAVEKWYSSVVGQLHEAPGTGQGQSARRSARRALAATVFDLAKQELMAIPPGAKESALLTRMVLALPPSKIAIVRQRLLETVRELGREFRFDDESPSADDCERWALTLFFAPTSGPTRPE